MDERRVISRSKQFRRKRGRNVEQALAEKARVVLSEVEQIWLSQRDFERFLQAINTSVDPTPALREAADGYKQLREQEPTGNW